MDCPCVHVSHARASILIGMACQPCAMTVFWAIESAHAFFKPKNHTYRIVCRTVFYFVLCNPAAHHAARPMLGEPKAPSTRLAEAELQVTYIYKTHSHTPSMWRSEPMLPGTASRPRCGMCGRLPHLAPRMRDVRLCAMPVPASAS
eukprot:358169-Chlamydomonas_euryale.AAC.3